MIVILHDIRYLDELLEALLDAGIPGATVLDSHGMLQILSKDVPIFAGLEFVFGPSNPQNKTILSVIPAGATEKYFAVIRRVLGELDTEGHALVFTVPIREFMGPARVLQENE